MSTRSRPGRTWPLLALLLTAGGPAPDPPPPAEGWAARCEAELRRAGSRLAGRDRRFEAGEVRRTRAMQDGRDLGDAVRCQACLARSYCFTADVTPAAMLPDEYPRRWEPVPEVTVCRAEGRRTERLAGLVDVSSAESPEPLPQADCPDRRAEALFVEVMRPAVEACLEAGGR